MFAAIPLALPADLQLAHSLAIRATELISKDAEAWRLRLDIARLLEDEEDINQSLRQLANIRPSDERILLERLDLALSDRQTVEDRLAGLDLVLAEPLPKPLEARLWWRRALLRQGRGDQDWRQDAAASVIADPSFSAPLAALVMPTLARENADPAEVIEALAALAAASPSDGDVAARLGRRLLRYGAYADARAALVAAVESSDRIDRSSPPALLADLLLSILAEDGPGAVRTELAARVMPLKQAMRMQLMSGATSSEDYQQPVPDPFLGVTSSRVSPDIALLLSAAAYLEGSDAPAEPVRRLLRLFTDGPTDLETRSQTSLALIEPFEPEKIDAFRLRASWWTLAFGGDPSEAQSDLDAMTTEGTVSEQDQAVFDGWFALRAGDFGKAEERLSTRLDDPRARLGLARVALLTDRSEMMVDHAAFVARSIPDSVIGVVAVRMLSEHFGRPVRPGKHALVAAAAAGDVPEHLQELHLYPERVLQIRFVPQDTIGQPFARFGLTLEIKNIGSLAVPLGEGGLSEFLAIEIESDLSRRGMVRHGRPASMRLEGPLVLSPGEKHLQNIELRRLPVSTDIDRAAVLGIAMELQAVTQPIGLPVASGPYPMVKPGPIGSLVSSGTFRFPGSLLNKDVIRELRLKVEQSDEKVPLPMLAALGQYVAPGLDGVATEDVGAEIVLAREVFLAIYATLDAESRAFMAGVLPGGQLPASLAAEMADDPDPWVRIVFLLNHVSDEFDPSLDRARTDPDPIVQLTAEVVDGMIDLIRKIEG
ncbi:MAG: hypothetical protein CMJ28_04965 [Phycisphaerae bacterium]|nr:hypothetical protein [Phycisphaerae bacterium]